MRLWDVQTAQLLQTFSQHGNNVNDVAIRPMVNGLRVEVRITPLNYGDYQSDFKKFWLLFKEGNISKLKY